MSTNIELDKIALDSLRIRITKVFPAQVRSCIEELSEEQIWWRPNDRSNSVGNLVLHVCGALNHYLVHNIGGLKYERDRPAEFKPASSIVKDQLLATLDETVENVSSTFDGLSVGRLGNPSTEPAYYSTVLEDLFGIAVHVATHTGQIVYVTKMLKEGSLDELWKQTHVQAGAWNQ